MDMLVIVLSQQIHVKGLSFKPSTGAFYASGISVYEVGWSVGLHYLDSIPFLKKG